MNTHMISAFHDELEKIAGAAKVRRLAESMSNKLRQSAKLSGQIDVARANHEAARAAAKNMSFTEGLAATRPTRRVLDDLQSQKRKITKDMDKLELVRRRADKRFVQRTKQYHVKQKQESPAPTTYTQRTLGAESPKSLKKVAPTLDRGGGYWFADADQLTRRADAFQETADVLGKVQRSGPAKRRSFLDVYLSRPIVGAGVPARPPKPKQDHLLTLAKREVDDALKDAERQYIKAMREARAEVSASGLKSTLDRIKALAQQRS
jgi:hypothetical protein